MRPSAVIRSTSVDVVASSIQVGARFLLVARLGGFVLLLGGADYLGGLGVERRRGLALV